jgi:hypothetical protein
MQPIECALVMAFAIMQQTLIVALALMDGVDLIVQ